MNCICCNKEIPRERLEALPDTKTCFHCSSTRRKIGLVQASCSHKGYIMEIIEADSHASTIIPKRYKKSISKETIRTFGVNKSFNSINDKYPTRFDREVRIV